MGEVPHRQAHPVEGVGVEGVGLVIVPVPVLPHRDLSQREGPAVVDHAGGAEGPVPAQFFGKGGGPPVFCGPGGDDGLRAAPAELLFQQGGRLPAQSPPPEGGQEVHIEERVPPPEGLDNPGGGPVQEQGADAPVPGGEVVEEIRLRLPPVDPGQDGRGGGIRKGERGVHPV